MILINQSHKPDGQLLADGDVDVVGKNIGIGDVGDLLERLVFAAHLKSDLSINFEVALVFSVFYRVRRGQLINHKVFSNCAGVEFATQRVEDIGVVDIYLVGLLHLL